mmetsp:Transcript_135008/g.190916  ORF Transcript_135008/g.190916 Transcript_135008/m.190916 type:complete len:248 (-) Transcript_135008:203-946(-)
MTSVESVYNLIPKEAVRHEKAELYQSTNRETIRQEYEQSKAPGRLFGPRGTQKPDPKNFTKKRAGETKRQTVKKAERFDATKTRQTVLAPATEARPAPSKEIPRHTDKANITRKTTKNFVKDNRNTALHATGRRVSEPAAFKGTGKVPAYITKRKSELQAEHEKQATMRAQADSQNGLTQMPEDERQSLLNGLKANHNVLQKAYLGLSVIVDTIPKKEKKQAMERQLADLERDIALLERHNTVFIRS